MFIQQVDVHRGDVTYRIRFHNNQPIHACKFIDQGIGRRCVDLWKAGDRHHAESLRAVRLGLARLSHR